MPTPSRHTSSRTRDLRAFRNFSATSHSPPRRNTPRSIRQLMDIYDKATRTPDSCIYSSLTRCKTALLWELSNSEDATPYCVLDPVLFAPVRALPLPASAQGNYEVQVYPYETVEPRHNDGGAPFQFHVSGLQITMTARCRRPSVARNHRDHHGFTDWFKPASTFSVPRRAARFGLRWQSHPPPRARSPKCTAVGSAFRTKSAGRAPVLRDTWTWRSARS